jgi:hypothetical protein
VKDVSGYDASALRHVAGYGKGVFYRLMSESRFCWQKLA